ncbi:prenyltransferase [Oceanobacillus halotolerans]|uniref:prenyltransferase n=1 Tax=Oceanobacillus halotolerans TaxID=2663380 RepID=UPI001CF78511|nr:prenyltransferase [Oceanobacillus halotolerans]
MYTKKATIPVNIQPQTYYFRFSWIQLIRPLTLTGTVSPILAGTILAVYQGTIQFHLFIVLLFACLCIQAATNMLNDYFDFRNGQDLDKWFTKSQRITTHHPPHHLIPAVASVLLVIAIIVGAWLAFHTNPWIIMVGIIGILAGIYYSRGSHSLSSLGLGETTAAIFLGFVPGILAYTIQGNAIDLDIIILSIPFALLITTMILTNNIRDIEKDQSFRHTVPIRIGKRNAIRLLTTILVLTYLTVLILILLQQLPWTTAMMILALPIATKLRWSFRKEADRMEQISAMKFAAWHNWVFSLLFITGLLVSL